MCSLPGVPSWLLGPMTKWILNTPDRATDPPATWENIRILAFGTAPCDLGRILTLDRLGSSTQPPSRTCGPTEDRLFCQNSRTPRTRDPTEAADASLGRQLSSASSAPLARASFVSPCTGAKGSGGNTDLRCLDLFVGFQSKPKKGYKHEKVTRLVYGAARQGPSALSWKRKTERESKTQTPGRVVSCRCG